MWRGESEPRLSKAARETQARRDGPQSKARQTQPTKLTLLTAGPGHVGASLKLENLFTHLCVLLWRVLVTSGLESTSFTTLLASALNFVSNYPRKQHHQEQFKLPFEQNSTESHAAITKMALYLLTSAGIFFLVKSFFITKKNILFLKIKVSFLMPFFF